jgi:hypothetical protein
VGVHTNFLNTKRQTLAGEEKDARGEGSGIPWNNGEMFPGKQMRPSKPWGLNPIGIQHDLNISLKMGFCIQI